MRERERGFVCVRESVCVCVCVSERKRESGVCKRDSKRDREFVYVRDKECVRERERESVCECVFVR